MKKISILFAKIIGIIAALLIVALVVAFFILNSASFQNKVLNRATVYLHDKLQTKISIDSIRIDVVEQEVELYRVEIEDREHRKMFQMDELDVSVNLWKLLSNEVCIKKAEIGGLRAQLFKEPGQPANYQFVIDAFKKDKKPAEKKDSTSKKGKKIVLNLQDVRLRSINMVYNDKKVQLGQLYYSTGIFGGEKAKITNLSSSWVGKSKKGDIDMSMNIGELTMRKKGKERLVEISNARYVTNNHRPRKNTGKPKRGFFDHGHLDITANMKIVFNHIGKDYVAAQITEATIKDPKTGFDISSLKLKARVKDGVAHIKDFALKQRSTTVNIDTAMLVLPSKKQGRKLRYSTGTITGYTLLKDISRAFSQALKNFSVPLTFSTRIEGTDNSIDFYSVRVSSPDKKLNIAANGSVRNMKDKFKLQVVFKVKQMHTTSQKAVEIINQFAVKKLMLDQLDALKHIKYTGSFAVYHKREAFEGVLNTDVGDIRFDINLDERAKYLTGNASTDNLNLGKTFAVKELGKIVCKTNFSVDYDKHRTAKMRKDMKGKLPIGKAHIEIGEVNYSKTRLKDIFCELESDGAEAVGDIDKPGKAVSYGMYFSYICTTDGTKTKVKPKMRVHVFDKLFKKKDKSNIDNNGDTVKQKKSFFSKLNIFKKKKKGANADSAVADSTMKKQLWLKRLNPFKKKKKKEQSKEPAE